MRDAPPSGRPMEVTMKPEIDSEDFLSGEFEGLIEAAHVVQEGIERGLPVRRILFEVLELADRVNVSRTMRFDTDDCEFVARAS
jgi:hypothetical protein